MSTHRPGRLCIAIRERFKCEALYLYFESEEQSLDYGSELHVQLTTVVAKRLAVGAKLAFFDAEAIGVDSDKFWVWAQFSF